jgi:hypothetical protein
MEGWDNGSVSFPRRGVEMLAFAIDGFGFFKLANRRPKRTLVYH